MESDLDKGLQILQEVSIPTFQLKAFPIIVEKFSDLVVFEKLQPIIEEMDKLSMYEAYKILHKKYPVEFDQLLDITSKIKPDDDFYFSIDIEKKDKV